MANPPQIPLHLCQVLEDEFINLHGQLPAEEHIKINERPITAKREWLFNKGHLKNPTLFAANLVETHHRLNADQDAPVNPAFKYLVERLSSKTRAQLSNHDSAQPLPEELEIALLNKILKIKDLYAKLPFTDDSLSEELQELIRLGVNRQDHVQFVGDDLIRFNRLLLEEVCPNELEKIYEIRLAAIYQRIHEKELMALCLSGGGIRSGTFALGVVQGLARHDLLAEIDYLSTVSGGGYTGSWLTAWLHRHPEGLEGVTNELKNAAPESKIDPEPEPLLYLRDYSNYITPKVGLLTADSWTFIAIYLRNLLLNWSVSIPLLLAALMIPRLCVGFIRTRPSTWRWSFLGFDLSLADLFLALGFILGVAALMYAGLARPGVSVQLKERSPFWRSRMGQDSFLRWCLLPLLGAIILLTAFWVWSPHSENGSDGWVTLAPFNWSLPKWFAFALFGLAFHFGAWLMHTLFLRRYKPQNWREFSFLELFIVLATGAVGGMLAWVLAFKLFPNPVPSASTGWTTELYACYAGPLLLAMFLLAATLFVGLSSRPTKRQRIGDEDREWWSRFGAWVLIALLVWSIFSSLVIFGPLLLFASPKLIASLGGLTGIVSILAGRSSKTPVNDEHAKKNGWPAIISNNLLPIAAATFFVFLVIVLSALTSWIIQKISFLFSGTNPLSGWLSTADSVNQYLNYLRSPAGELRQWATVHYSSFWLVGSLILLLFGIGLVMARFVVNLNKFSLHAGYRDRIIRAYLGASRHKGERDPNPFTGFDPADNIQMHELRPGLFHYDAGDFKDLRGLVIKLQKALDESDGADEMSRYLADRLDETTTDLLQDYNGSGRLPQPLQIGLIEELNRLLQEDNFDQAQSLVHLSKAAKIQKVAKLLTQSQRGDYAIIRNRFFLELAYPDEIKTKYPPPPYRLLPVLNLTLNLVGGDKLAWQQRKAEPFSVTPLHSGSFRLGYRRSKDYGGQDGISLGTATTISGAAVSSNMGFYTSSPAIAFVLTFFNIRLGWWLGNPGPAGEKTYRRSYPTYSIKPVLSEAFGMTDDKNKYVYLTDGGHFENSGLYEMVLRRCHTIVVVDGSQDADYAFNDLGNAVRKIRIDLGVPIEFDKVPIYAQPPEGKKGSYWALGNIRYSCVDGDVNGTDGVLIYIKGAIYGDEPRDVLQYQKTNEAFPHESTADQFFSEPQFESYRILGSYIMDRICGEKHTKLSVAEFVQHAKVRLG